MNELETKCLKRIVDGDYLGDAHHMGISPELISRGLVQIAREYDGDAALAWDELRGVTLMNFVNRDLMGEWQVIMPGEITGMETLDRAVRLSLRRDGLLETVPLENCEYEACHGTGYVGTRYGMQVGKEMAADRVAYGEFGTFDFKEDLRVGFNDSVARSMLAKVYEYLCYIPEIWVYKKPPDLRPFETSHTRSETADELKVPTDIVLAVFRCLIERRVMKRHGPVIRRSLREVE